MADKICPPQKKVNQPDGLNQPSSHTTITTPDPTFGRYFGDTSADSALGNSKENNSIFSKKK